MMKRRTAARLGVRPILCRQGRAPCRSSRQEEGERGKEHPHLRAPPRSQRLSPTLTWTSVDAAMTSPLIDCLLRLEGIVAEVAGLEAEQVRPSCGVEGRPHRCPVGADRGHVAGVPDRGMSLESVSVRARGDGSWLLRQRMTNLPRMSDGGCLFLPPTTIIGR